MCCTVSCGVCSVTQGLCERTVLDGVEWPGGCSVTQGLCERTVMDGVEWPGVLHCIVWCVFSHTGAV